MARLVRRPPGAPVRGPCRGPRRGRALLATAAAGAAGLPLAGCTTTQHEAQRLQLDAARQRAALRPTRVRIANPTVTPTSVALVSRSGRTAFVVRIRNRGQRTVTDLPISVGFERPGGDRVYLNAAAGRPYFDAHLPAIPARRSLTWVDTASRSLPAGARPFAIIGRRPSAPARPTDMGVRIGAGYRHTPAAGSVTVRLDNPTSVPQYELQVYAYAREHGRYVTAGNATVADLAAGGRQHIRLAVTGIWSGRLHVEAVPTIEQ